MTAISCNHVSADVTRGDRTKEDASTSHQIVKWKRQRRGRRRKKIPPRCLLTEAASYDVPVSEGIIRCEDRIRLRSNKDMRRHTVDSFRFGDKSETCLMVCVCIFMAGCSSQLSAGMTARLQRAPPESSSLLVLTGRLNTVLHGANNVSSRIHTVLCFSYNYRSSCSVGCG